MSQNEKENVNFIRYWSKVPKKTGKANNLFVRGNMKKIIAK